SMIIRSYFSEFYDGTVSYLLPLPPRPTLFPYTTLFRSGPMTDGATNAGNIYQGDFDTWTFTATQGDYIALSVGTETQTTAHFAPWIRLVSPTGALLGKIGRASCRERVDATGATSGTNNEIKGSY